MIELRIESPASAEAAEAARWYEDNQEGLGSEFMAELDATLQRVVETPDIYAEQYRGIRRALVRRFPYAVYFDLEPGVATVIAVLHQHQQSERWHSRR
ncbi:MAG: type II toxin-antitoxin system RelE/ParE family toxin [Chromatiales bacterium]|nr:type II toxin-antitoxin system RelE/ParE family toxin [Chromatiales bacterium]